MELKDILIGSPIPLHPNLANEAGLSIKLVIDGTTCEEAHSVLGDPMDGIWEVNASLHVPQASQSVSLKIISNKGGRRKQVFVATVSTFELFARLRARPDGYHEFVTCDSCSSIQVILSFKIMASPLPIGTSSFPIGIEGSTGDFSFENNEGAAPTAERSVVPPSDNLESAYTRLQYISNPDSRSHGLNAIGCAYYERYQKVGRTADLEKAVSVHEEAMRSISNHHLRFVGFSSDLGAALSSRFDQNGAPADIERAISLYQQALVVTRDVDPDKAILLGSLGLCFMSRYQRFGKEDDLNRVITTWKMAVDSTPEKHPGKPGRLNALGDASYVRFERLGNPADLEQVISLLQSALDLTPDEDPGKMRRLNNLGTALLIQFKTLGRLADLEHAISVRQNVLDLTPDEDPDRPDHLTNLGNAFEQRFGQLGNLGDLEQAISLQQNAVDLTPNEHLAKPRLLNNLGNAFEARFKHFGSMADLQQALTFQQNAVDLTPDEHPDRSQLLNNLGNTFQARYDRLGSLTDLEQAISLKQSAVSLTSNEHPNRSQLLNNLGTAFNARFEHLGNHADLEQSISLKQDAVNLTPNEHPGKSSRLSNLAYAFRTRFNRLGNLDDLERAISLEQKAVDLMSDENPDKASLLSNRGFAFQARFRCLGSPHDLENAVYVFSAAAGLPTGKPMVRFKAAREWARTLTALNRSPLPAFDCAIKLLPRVAWLGLPFTDQHAHLAQVGNVVRDAVTAAIEMEECETAVEWAEQGRSILWQNLLGLRSPVEDLRKVRPDLAHLLQYISQRLEGSSSRGDSISGMDAAPSKQVIQSPSELAVEWDKVVEEVRKVPSFEYFLKAKGFDTLAPAAHEGPVIILNVHDDRCDALVLISDTSKYQNVSAVHIPLKDFSYKMAEDLAQTLSRILVSSGVRAREARKSDRIGHSVLDKNLQFKEILSTLWLYVAKPVIDGLGYQTRLDHPPHLWWCTTGPLAFLPIHAAGVYDETGAGEKLSDYVVSSYTPTLTAILGSSQPVASPDFRLLAISQPSTPNASPLPGTAEEITLIKNLAGGLCIESLTKDEATVERVLRAMERSTWIHLACHGKQDIVDSMKSGFLLHDRTLELSEIIKIQLPKADFAFLSACQTATGDENVAEESMHLAAGMLFSGCRGVIATMWSIGDEDAPQVAGDVYRMILEDGKPDGRQAAYALHQAVQRLQKNGAGFLSWVPFIHIGR